jgi:glutamine amidotransferase
MLANGLDRDAQSACTLTLAQIEDLMVRARITEPLRFTAAFSNGRELYAVRYASDRRPPTLYTKTCQGKGSTLIVSEPLDEVRDGWLEVPQQSFVTVTERGAELAALPVVRGAEAAPVP